MNTPLDQNSIERAGRLGKEALETFGEATQIAVATEELGELIVALQRRHRGRAGDEEIAEEVADVFVVLNSIAHLVGPDKVRRHLLNKLFRLEDRIAKRNGI